MLKRAVVALILFPVVLGVAGLSRLSALPPCGFTQWAALSKCSSEPNRECQVILEDECSSKLETFADYFSCYSPDVEPPYYSVNCVPALTTPPNGGAPQPVMALCQIQTSCEFVPAIAVEEQATEQPGGVTPDEGATASNVSVFIMSGTCTPSTAVTSTSQTVQTELCIQ